MNKEIIPVNQIELALKEANITEQVIAGLQTYRSLVVKDENDKAGYDIVHRARMECKGLRVLAQKIAKGGREEAIKVQKAWIDAEKSVTLRIGEVENYLEGQEAIVTEAQKKRDQEAKEKAERDARERFESRANALMKVGVFKTVQEIATMVDSDFDALLKQSTDIFDAAQKKAAGDEEKRKVEQKRLDDQRAEQEKKDAEQKAAQEKIDDANRAQEIKDAEARAAEKAKFSERMGHINGFKSDLTVPNWYGFDDIKAMSDEVYQNTLVKERKDREDRDEIKRKKEDARVAREAVVIERTKQLNAIGDETFTLRAVEAMSDTEFESKVVELKAEVRRKADAEAARLESLKPDFEKLDVISNEIEEIIGRSLSLATPDAQALWSSAQESLWNVVNLLAKPE